MPTAVETADIAQMAAGVRPCAWASSRAWRSSPIDLRLSDGRAFGDPARGGRDPGIARCRFRVRRRDVGKRGAEPAAMALYPFCRLKGQPTSSSCRPSHSASISTKMLQEIGGATVIGSASGRPGKSVRSARSAPRCPDIVNMAAMAAYDIAPRGLCVPMGSERSSRSFGEHHLIEEPASASSDDAPGARPRSPRPEGGERGVVRRLRAGGSDTSPARSAPTARRRTSRPAARSSATKGPRAMATPSRRAPPAARRPDSRTAPGRNRDRPGGPAHSRQSPPRSPPAGSARASDRPTVFRPTASCGAHTGKRSAVNKCASSSPARRRRQPDRRVL